MPYSFAIDAEARLITIRYLGAVTFDDIRNSSRETLVHGRPSHRLLADMRKISAWRTTTKELRDLARDFVSASPGFTLERAAAVAPGDAVYGDVRAWIAITDSLSYPREVFRDLESAMSWLDASSVSSLKHSADHQGS